MLREEKKTLQFREKGKHILKGDNVQVRQAISKAINTTGPIAW